MRECCTDHKGKPKKKYPIKEDALDIAMHLEIEKSIYVKVYQCDARDGWHLTSHNVPRQSNLISASNTQVSRHQPQNLKKRKGTGLGKILGKELFKEIKDKVHRHDIEKLEGERKILSDQRKLKKRK